MKKLLVIHSNMELGGAETSLLGLLQSIDYSKIHVDLLFLEKKGELLGLLPEEVNVLPGIDKYQCLVLPIKDVLLKKHSIALTIARILGKLRGNNYYDRTYMTKQFAHRYALPFLPQIKGQYDMAISFIDPHFVVAEKVDARIKSGWLHTDFSRVNINSRQDKAMWNALDYIVHISDSSKEKFDVRYPDLERKSIVIENVLSKQFIQCRANEVGVAKDMPDNGEIKLLSIGRFCNAKNFENVPNICSRLISMGFNVVWYLIGFGGSEALIREKIVEAGMRNHVIILGKKENPYPYIKKCDLYVQPSRYEGKSVTVREAQMLCKPVVITRYATSAGQLEDGVDGVIVPMDNEGCAKGIAELLRAPQRMEALSAACRERDYSNRAEVEKLYKLMQ